MSKSVYELAKEIISERARKAGKARWRGITSKERSRLMSEIAKKPRKVKAV